MKSDPKYSIVESESVNISKKSKPNSDKETDLFSSILPGSALNPYESFVNDSTGIYSSYLNYRYTTNSEYFNGR